MIGRAREQGNLPGRKEGPTTGTRIGGLRSALLYSTPVWLILIVFFAGPILLVLPFSFRDIGLLSGLEGWAGWSNFRNVFGDAEFWFSLRITVAYTILSVVGQLMLGVTMAIIIFPLNRGAGLLRTMLVIPYLLSPVVVGLMWRMILNPSVGVLNFLLRGLGVPESLLTWYSNTGTALFSIIVAQIWFWAPFVMLFAVAGLRQISLEVWEAARLDGASGWKFIRSILLPLLRPFLALAAVFTTTFTLRQFGLIWSMTKGGPAGSTRTLPLFLYERMFTFFDMGAAAAVGVVMVGLTLIVTVPLLLVVVRGQEET